MKRLAPVSLLTLSMLSCSHEAAPERASAQQIPAAAVVRGALVAPKVAPSASPRMLWAVGQQPAPANLSAEQAARVHLARHAKALGVSSRSAEALRLRHVGDLGRGPIVVSFAQQVHGLEVYRGDVKLLMRRDHQLVALVGNLVEADEAAPLFASTKQQALATAVGGHFNVTLPDSDVRHVGTSDGGYDRFDLAGALRVGSTQVHLRSPARVKPVMFQSDNGVLEPAYFVEFVARIEGQRRLEAFRYLIAASDGRVLERANLVSSEAFNYRVWAHDDALHTPTDSPLADYTPHPSGTPNGSEPPFTAPTLVSMEGFNTNPNGEPDPWLPANATTTQGNNVDAYADWYLPDGYSSNDKRATLSGPLSFDYIYNTSLGPMANTTQTMASITQAFYVTNWMHDWYYDSGFNEAAGNGQQDNFGRGGVPGDRLLIEAQDSAPDSYTRDNANMLTLADGEPPVMQLYLWSAPPGSVERDGALDNTVVAHEWGHYMHLRLSQCSMGMCEAISEGAADFIALHMVLRDGDDLDGVYGLAAYAARALSDDSSYYGIRRVPYSVSFDKNALTFRHASDSASLPTQHPVSHNSAPNSEVHNAGEVFATMMFEAYVSLQKQAASTGTRTFEQTRRLMSDYLVAAFKLLPPDATFTEVRDALLAVSYANDPADMDTLAQAFARRGAGSCAVPPDRYSWDYNELREDFTVAPVVAVGRITLDDSAKSCDSDGVLDTLETGKLNIEIINAGPGQMVNPTVTISTNSPDLAFLSDTQLTLGTVLPFQTAIASVDVKLADGVNAITPLDLQIHVNSPQACEPNLQINEQLQANFDLIGSTSDDFETNYDAWTREGPTGASTWSRKLEGSNHYWHGLDMDATSDGSLVSPSLQVGSGPLTMSFQHKFRFEGEGNMSWDGGVIEISTNGGASWQDISVYGNPGYNGTIYDGLSNALAGRAGFVQTSTGWPTMQPVTVDFGTALAGQTIKIRFRIGTDASVGREGWMIDNVSFTGLDNTPFGELVDDATVTCPEPPVAVAGADQSVAAGATVVLDASASSDPNSDPLSFVWSQTSGPDVTLTGANAAVAEFVAPSLDHDSDLTFEVAVSDGTFTATDQVQVHVAALVVEDAGADAQEDAAADAQGEAGEPDAAEDAGSEAAAEDANADAPEHDSATGTDAAGQPDAHTGSDAATTEDAAGTDGPLQEAEPQESDEGCACTVGTSAPGRSLAGVLVAAALMLVRRRRA